MNLIKRNAEIVRLLKTGNYTLVQVGQIFDISRERVRQLHKRETGKGVHQYRVSRGDKRRKRAKKERNFWLNQVKFICAGCGKSTKNKNALHKRKFCQDCRNLQVIEQRDPILIHICEVCGGEFHPYRNIKYGTKAKGRFCDMFCYIKYLKKHPLCLYKKVVRKYDYKKIVELRKLEMTYREIREIIGCSDGTIIYALKEEGLLKK